MEITTPPLLEAKTRLGLYTDVAESILKAMLIKADSKLLAKSGVRPAENSAIDYNGLRAFFKVVSIGAGPMFIGDKKPFLYMMNSQLAKDVRSVVRGFDGEVMVISADIANFAHAEFTDADGAKHVMRQIATRAPKFANELKTIVSVSGATPTTPVTFHTAYGPATVTLQDVECFAALATCKFKLTGKAQPSVSEELAKKIVGAPLNLIMAERNTIAYGNAEKSIRQAFDENAGLYQRTAGIPRFSEDSRGKIVSILRPIYKSCLGDTKEALAAANREADFIIQFMNYHCR